MNFDSLKSLKSGYTVLAIWVVVWTIITALSTCFLFYMFMTDGQKGYRSIWIIDPKSGESYRAVQFEKASNPGRIFEYKNHVRLFHMLWFELDEFTYENNVEKGLNLIGNSGKELLDNYKKSDALRHLQEENMHTKYYIDSIKVDMNTVPVTGWCYGRQEVIKTGGKSMRKMWTKFTFIDLPNRSDENPHGVKLDNFSIEDRTQIEESQQY